MPCPYGAIGASVLRPRAAPTLFHSTRLNTRSGFDRVVSENSAERASVTSRPVFACCSIPLSR